jgi:ABC-2 type transport system ATP-binding protein
VPGVTSVEPKSDGGAAAFEISTEAGQDVRAEVARAVVQRGFDLLELHSVGMSLEEIFLHLTTSDAGEEAATAPAPTTTEVNP